MTSTCCCGCCTLSTATQVAIGISIIQSVIGLFWNIQLLQLLNRTDTICVIDLIISVDVINDFKVVHGLNLTSLTFHVLWIVFSLMLIRANATLNRATLTPWVLFTYLQTLFDIGSSVYFAVKFQSSFMASKEFWDLGTGLPTATLTYLSLAVLFSRGIIFWILNAFLAHVVDRRGKEISDNNSMMAFYILSHLSNNRRSCNHQAEDATRTPSPPNNMEPPPSYCSTNYLPKYLIAGNRESLESSWSVNYEDLQGVTAFENPIYPRIGPISVSDLRRLSAGNVLTNNNPAPYGNNGAAMEQSIRFQNSQGVLPC